MTSLFGVALRVLLVLSISMLAVAAFVWHRAEREAIKVETQARSLGAMVDECARLRHRIPGWAIAGASESDSLAKRAGEIAAACGLPSSTLASFTVQAETHGPSSKSGIRAERRRAAIVLSNITLPQLGGFLAAWNSREPTWTITSIDISADLAGSSRFTQSLPGLSTGSDLPLRVVLAADAFSLRSPPGARFDRNGGS